MKLAFFLLWLAGGGLITMEAFVGWQFLKACKFRHEAAAQELWDILVRREHA